MKSFAQMTDAERRYHVEQLFAEAVARELCLEKTCEAVAALFVTSGVPAPVSLFAWLQGEPTQHYRSASLH